MTSCRLVDLEIRMKKKNPHLNKCDKLRDKTIFVNSKSLSELNQLLNDVFNLEEGRYLDSLAFFFGEFLETRPI